MASKINVRLGVFTIIFLYSFGSTIGTSDMTMATTDIDTPLTLVNNDFMNGTLNSMSIASILATICEGNINQVRSNNGKRPVTGHQQVETAAYNHNVWMVRNNCFSHQCPGESPMGDRLSATGYRWRGVGEILAAGSNDCAGTVNQWVNSPGHMAIMIGDYQHVGCSGLICNNCQYGTYWTCVFANPA